MSHLQTTQRNKVIELVHSIGFDPNDFKWVDEQESGSHVIGRPALRLVIGVRLVHVPSKSYFVFIDGLKAKLPSRRGGGPHAVRYSPGRDYIKHEENNLQWNQALEDFYDWLTFLKREYEAPDLWKELSEGRLPVFNSQVDEDADFTPEEQNRVISSVDEFIEELRGQRDQRLPLRRARCRFRFPVLRRCDPCTRTDRSSRFAFGAASPNGVISHPAPEWLLQWLSVSKGES